MPLVTSEKMLLDAQKGGYAVGAFNVENMEMVKSVLAAAEELKAPFQSHKFFHKREAGTRVLVSVLHPNDISAGKVIF